MGISQAVNFIQSSKNHVINRLLAFLITRILAKKKLMPAASFLQYLSLLRKDYRTRFIRPESEVNKH